ncbi:putative inactive group IIC secretory phospholipase A2 [Neophocaena asiaeorientalis asiaeorientalis]|uniref:Inactive group IIC secretory phospholipase A2 n=1 Tax=Neophocaena asiaeorientalis asiaeorientalis TaxID=1706337 RepID=A0A341BVN9_NEOAA|nr:putative inactive group IIC secretory phospholipase A2 [Neophocaena asiaeorientalis asiaeorientalis]
MDDIPLSLGVCVRSVLPSQEAMTQRFPRALGFRKARELSHSGNVMAPTHGSFWQFQRMVKHITGRSAFFSNYGYGCYCGLGGIGIPMDDTARASPESLHLDQLPYQPSSPSQDKSSPTLPPVILQFKELPCKVECALGPGVGCLCGLRACECDTQSASKRTCPNFKRFFSSWPRCGRSKLQC